MTTTALADAVRLIVIAETAFEDDPEVVEALTAIRTRLEEPLRIGLAGIVKAGKSTLLNALLGERIAPTDAGECTRVVTWYRYSDTPTILAHLKSGDTHPLPIRRDKGCLVLELDELPLASIERIEVGWPSRPLRTVTLIDTPGIESLTRSVSQRATDFLIPEDSPSSADAIIYLMRHMHVSDQNFLEAFQDTAAGMSKTVNAVAILSRADEIGSGRIDSMLSASKVAARYAGEGSLAALALGVLPVAGLLGEAARTLREEEFRHLQRLAGLDRDERELVLVSADRFVRDRSVAGVSRSSRRNLLSRFGIFGIRVGISLIRAGAANSTQLAQELVGQSGLNDLLDVIDQHFYSRAEVLKAKSALDSLELLLQRGEGRQLSRVERGIERIRISSHGLRELSLLSQLRVGETALPSTWAERAERIVGGSGTSARARLGAREGTGVEKLRSEAISQLDEWRALAQFPTMTRAGADAARVVIRSLEEITVTLGNG